MTTLEAPTAATAARARVGARFLGAVGAQFMQALSSLCVSVIAARELTATQFGTFTLLYALLIVASAVHTGLIGDSLTVLDRHAPDVAWGLRTVCVGSLLLMGSVGFAAALSDDLLTPGGALLFAALVAVWLLEETLRRLLMSELRFWRVVLTDGTALVGMLAGFFALPGHGVDHLLLALIVGQSVATVLASGLLHPDDRRPVRPSAGAHRPVLSYGIWRALFAAARPFVLLVLRLIVAGVATRAALGSLEAARVLVAPTLLLVAGAGSYLLPTLTAADRVDREAAERRARRLSVLLSVGTALVGLLSVVLAGPLGPLLTGGSFPVTQKGVAAWAVYATTYAATMPWATLAAVRRAARQVFFIRVFEGALSLGLASLALLVLHLPAEAGPLAVAIPGIAAVTLMRRTAQRQPVRP